MSQRNPGQTLADSFSRLLGLPSGPLQLLEVPVVVAISFPRPFPRACSCSVYRWQKLTLLQAARASLAVGPVDSTGVACLSVGRAGGLLLGTLVSRFRSNWVVQLQRARWRACISMKLRRPHGPFSTPMPLHFAPPNGWWGARAAWVLTQVLGQRPAGLAHEPDRGYAARFATAGTDEGGVSRRIGHRVGRATRPACKAG
jgi:hypothetical protein